LKLIRGIVASIAASACLALAAPAGAEAFTIGGKRCELIEVPAAAPVGTSACPGVRPGAYVETDKGQCSLNFLFRAADGRRYIGTAGHCILGESALGGEDAGERTWAPGTGPAARDSNGSRIGEFAYAVLQDPKDFALIRLDENVQASPQMCHFGGPTGTNSDRTSTPTLLHHYGNGLVVGNVLPARSALALGTPNPDHVLATGVVVPGDSGSGVISSDGRAVGVAVALGIGLGGLGSDGLDAGPVIITRIAPQEARAEHVLGTALTLQTAPAL
jgi:hypothetical protein